MSTFNRNMELSVGCPKCGEVFKDTLPHLLEMNPMVICPICGPVQMGDPEEHRQYLQQIGRMLLELERPSRN